MRIQLLAVVASLTATTSLVSAGLIPPERLADWSTNSVGVPGGIPARGKRIIDVTARPFKADPTGATDARPAIHAALLSAGFNDVVYLPPGTYRVDGPVLTGGETLKSFYTLRGAGTNTVLRVKDALLQFGAGVDWGSSFPAPSNHIVSGFERGSSNLLLQVSLPRTYAGGMIYLSQSNGPSVLHAQADYQSLQQQKSVIQSIFGRMVTIWPPVCLPLQGALSPTVKIVPPANLCKFAGLEDLVIEAGQSGAATIIGFDQAYGCWVKGVRINRIKNYGISVYNSVRCEIRESRIDSSQSSGPNHAGLIFYWASGCLIENNILLNLFPHIEVNNGSSANVFAYNLCLDSDIPDMMGASIDSNHGPHNSFNLYEGNKAQGLQADGYFGSVSDDTLFRNWLTGTNSRLAFNGKAVNLNRWAYRYNLVGNVLGAPGRTWVLSNANGAAAYERFYCYCFGLPNIGNGGFNGKYGPPLQKPDYQELDTNVLATATLRGNWNYATGGVPENEALGKQPLLPSLFRPGPPSWWGGLPWPAFGPDTARTNRIPAEVRYERLK